jgi:hypothetical protein
MRPLHRGAGRHRDTGQPDGAQQGDGYYPNGVRSAVPLPQGEDLSEGVPSLHY